MKRTRLEVGDRNQANIYLRPVIDALVNHGNVPASVDPRSGPFWGRPDGWECVMRDPIDWEYLQQTFEFPDEIAYDAEHDVIWDRHGWAAIRGSGGAGSTAAPW